MSHLVPTRAKVLTSLSLLCSINATSDGLRKCRVSRQETRPRVKTRANRAYNCKRQKTAVAQARCSTRRARGTRATSAARQPNSHTQCSTLSKTASQKRNINISQRWSFTDGRGRQTFHFSVHTSVCLCSRHHEPPSKRELSSTSRLWKDGEARHKRSCLRSDSRLHM